MSRVRHTAARAQPENCDGAQCAADSGNERAGAPRRCDRQHDRSGCLGHSAGPLLGRDDVVFGVTVAGRPPELAGIERMVGLFINTLPLRVKLAPEKPLLALLREVQDAQSKLIAHQHVGLSEIQSAMGLGELFDTLVVFENYPFDGGVGPSAENNDGLRLVEVSGRDATHYPLV